MSPLRLSARLVAALALLLLPLRAAAQPPGITNGFPYTTDPADTAASPWLPAMPAEPAGAHGFLQHDQQGNFRFDDGTPARFYGVTLQWTAALPDSTGAIATAARLRKLGVNLVRLQYIDNAYDWGGWSTILDDATGFRTLHPERMRRLDWFIAQLKSHGIYSYLILQSARIPRGSDGLGADADSVLWLGTYLNYLYPAARSANKEVARQILDHTNPFTGAPYKNEPAVAMLELVDQGSLISRYRQGQTEYRPDGSTISWRHSSRLDSLFTGFLMGKYGSKGALAAAWRTTPPAGGFPNLIREGSFEGDFERFWAIDAYDGVSVSRILSQGDSVPDGDLALTLRVRNGAGNIYAGYMAQAVNLEFNTLYRLSFKAKCSNPAGRSIVVGGYQEGGMGAGINTQIALAPYWREQEAYFLVPVKSSTPFTMYFWYGDMEGDIQIDDVQIRAVESPGLQPEEMPANALVKRIPWWDEATRLVSSRRIEDQSEFYMTLEGNYLADLHRFVADTIGARQPVTGAGHYWASGYMETAIQRDFDFSAASAGWDWVSGDASNWQVRNYSQLRNDWGGSINTLARHAHRGQPYVTSFAHPFPNRYQAESMLMIPAYSLLQDWDGLILDSYADDMDLGAETFIDTNEYYTVAKNPLVTAMMPAAAHLFRNSLLKPAQGSISLRHSLQQARITPRMEGLWDYYALPGGMHGRAMLANRVTIDSADAEYFTQRDDIAFASEIEGEVTSDTREIIWEYNRGAISIDAPRAQGASGYLGRAGGVTLRNVSLDLLSANETATMLWVPLDTARPLGGEGRSLMVLASRTEPTGWQWRDSTHADRWGAGPMLLDPLKVRLTFNTGAEVTRISICPLDSAGNAAGAPIVLEGNGPKSTVIDQAQTRAVWYGVELAGAGAAGVEREPKGALLAAWPGTVTDRAYITVALGEPAGNARLELFDLLGRRARLLHEGAMSAGEQTIRLDAADLPAGTYLVRLATEGGTLATERIVVRR